LLDAFLARNAQILHFNDAPVNIVTSLQRWVGSNGGIARDETEFLDHSDLITLSTPVDCTLKDIESWIRAWLDPALSPVLQGIISSSSKSVVKTS
jgi:hypothetical protein